MNKSEDKYETHYANIQKKYSKDFDHTWQKATALLHSENKATIPTLDATLTV